MLALSCATFNVSLCEATFFFSFRLFNLLKILHCVMCSCLLKRELPCGYRGNYLLEVTLNTPSDLILSPALERTGCKSRGMRLSNTVVIPQKLHYARHMCAPPPN